MNYRQWKKKYKKIHGYNPPLKDDKRKQAKAIKKGLKTISTYDLESIAKTLMNGFSNVFRTIGETFINIADNLT